MPMRQSSARLNVCDLTAKLRRAEQLGSDTRDQRAISAQDDHGHGALLSHTDMVL